MISTSQFRSAMGAFPTGVTVVTTACDGVAYGMTVNALCSVSLDPLLLLVSLAKSSRGAGLVSASGVFSVSVLSASQQEVSRWFAAADRPGDSSMFDRFPVRTGVTGCPVLLGAAASFDCLVEQVVPAGDHSLVIGRVAAVAHAPGVEPLVFGPGGYRQLAAARLQAA